MNSGESKQFFFEKKNQKTFGVGKTSSDARQSKHSGPTHL
jgi:hypothetical protein